MWTEREYREDEKERILRRLKEIEAAEQNETARDLKLRVAREKHPPTVTAEFTRPSEFLAFVEALERDDDTWQGLTTSPALTDLGMAAGAKAVVQRTLAGRGREIAALMGRRVRYTRHDPAETVIVDRCYECGDGGERKTGPLIAGTLERVTLRAYAWPSGVGSCNAHVSLEEVDLRGFSQEHVHLLPEVRYGGVTLTVATLLEFVAHTGEGEKESSR